VAPKDDSASDTEPPGGVGTVGVAVSDEEALAALGYIECLRYCLEQRGEHRSQVVLMGVSGEVFRLCFDRNDPERGLTVVFHNPIRAACAALGFGCEVYHHSEVRDAAEDVGGHIGDQGPAIIHTSEDWVVIRQEPARPDQIMARLADGRLQAWPREHLERLWLNEPGLLELGLQGYYCLVLGDKEREPDEREAAMGSLRRGVRMLMRKSRIDGCAAGLAAYRELLDSLLRKHGSDEQHLRALHKYALWVAKPLIYARDSRRAAAEYLCIVQPQFDEETQEHLRKAADSYRQAAQALADVPIVEAPPAPPGEDLVVGRVERKALRGFAVSRRKASRCLARAQRAEEEGLLEIRRALESAEKKEKENA
jgi:hypothetical protein